MMPSTAVICCCSRVRGTAVAAVAGAVVAGGVVDEEVEDGPATAFVGCVLGG